MAEDNSNKSATQRNTRQRGPGGPGGFGHMGPGDKPDNFKKAVSSLVKYLGSYKWTILIVWTLAITSTIFAILGPRILGDATDELFKGIMAKVSGTGEVDFGAIGQIMMKLVILYLISTGLAYAQGLIMSVMTMKMTYRLRSDINNKIHNLPFKFYDKTNHGEVLSRITNDVDVISQTLNQNLTQIITAAASIIGISIMMFSISWQLSLAAVCIIPATAIFVIVIMKKSQPHFKAQQALTGKLNGHVEEMLSNHIIVRAFNGEEKSLGKFAGYNNDLYTSAWKSNFLSGLIMPVSMFISNIGYVIICILGGYIAANGNLTIGGIQSFIQYLRQFTQPLSQIANISNVLQQTAAASERVFTFLEETEEVPETEGALKVCKSYDEVCNTSDLVIKGNVTFKNIRFGYNPDKIIIKNFSSDVEQGKKIAIVGPTGAGKTTIVKLLMRFYDVDDGKILLDGHDIRDFTRNSLRSSFGMVLQDTWLFNSTIMENIRYGRLSATDDEVRSAAIAAQADHFIRTLPDGYNMVLNEEANNISSGQKQLLTIARAILADPQVLILDEATSSVDTRTELHIQKAMDNLMHGRTTFVIAHRLSTIKNADLILVMKDGDIIEQGTHSELLKGETFYSSLYNSQFEPEEQPVA